METTTVTRAEVERGLARFDQLRSTSQYLRRAVPQEFADAVEPLLSPQVLYFVLGPDPGEEKHLPYRGIGPDDTVIMIAECEPGKGPPLHAHHLTHEIFFVAEGSFRVEWGDEGEHSIDLGRFDTLCIPPGCARRFENTSETTGYMFAIATGSEHVTVDTAVLPKVLDQIVQDIPPVEGLSAQEWLARAGYHYEPQIPTEQRLAGGDPT